MDQQAITFRLPKNLYEQLRRTAFERRTSMNEIVVEGIELRLAQRNLTAAEQAIWAEWNRLPEDEPSPVKKIARALDMSPADVAFVVYPAETFGRVDDSQEPEI